MKEGNKSYLIEFAKTHATHQVELVIRFDPKKTGENEIEKTIFSCWSCCESIEHNPRKDNIMKIFIYVLFMEEWWNTVLVELHITDLLANIVFPNGVRKSDITIKVKKLI